MGLSREELDKIDPMYTPYEAPEEKYVWVLVGSETDNSNPKLYGIYASDQKLQAEANIRFPFQYVMKIVLNTYL